MNGKKYKTPDELGEAVGLKIEELFGTIVHDLPPEEPEDQSIVKERTEKAPTAPISRAPTPDRYSPGCKITSGYRRSRRAFPRL